VAEELERFSGIHRAMSSSAIRRNRMADLPLTEFVRNNFNASRSGDVYVVFAPNVFINDFDGLVVASTHGSPWQYDRHVPVIFAGAGVPAATVQRQVTPYAIAPTLAALLGVKPPSGAMGEVLPEVFPR
jgi:hypothetical protein